MEYFLIKPDGETTGTFSIEQVRAMLNSGFIGPDTRYWHEGISDWQPIGRIEESLNFEPPEPVEPERQIAPHRIAQVLKAVPPPSTKLEKLKIASGRLPRIDGPSLPAGAVLATPALVAPGVPVSMRESPGHMEHHAPEVYGPVEDATVEQIAPQTLPPRKTSRAEKIAYVVLGALLVIAVDYGPAMVRSIDTALAKKVTLSGGETFVLLDSATIKSYDQDIANSPTLDALQQQLAHTAEPMALERLKIGIETERARHDDEIRQQYLHDNSAEFIDAGTYRVTATLDVNGNPVAAKKAIWCAIPFHDHTVYANKAPDTAKPAAPTQ